MAKFQILADAMVFLDVDTERGVVERVMVNLSAGLAIRDEYEQYLAVPDGKGHLDYVPVAKDDPELQRAIAIAQDEDLPPMANWVEQ